MLEYLLLLGLVVVIALASFRPKGVIEQTVNASKDYYQSGTAAIMGGYYDDDGKIVIQDPKAIHGAWCAWSRCINGVKVRECACPRAAFGGEEGTNGHCVGKATDVCGSSEEACDSAKNLHYIPGIGCGCYDTEISSGGRCVACPSPKKACNNICIDMSADVNNCGACGNKCTSMPLKCINGRCICTPYCAANSCGDDGCGGACGSEFLECYTTFGTNGAPGCTTEGYKSCNIGAYGPCNAVDPRIANCAGKECGYDLCGGLCQPDKKACSRTNNLCAPTYGNRSCDYSTNTYSSYCDALNQHDFNCGTKECGPDGCGDVCGTCIAPKTKCNNSGYCCDPTCTDTSNVDCNNAFYNACNEYCGTGMRCPDATQDCRSGAGANTCSRDGGWSGWSSWSGCSATVGPGTQTSTRDCNNPPKTGYGNDCSRLDGGNSSKEQYCCTPKACAAVSDIDCGITTNNACGTDCTVGTLCRDVNASCNYGSCTCNWQYELYGGVCRKRVNYTVYIEQYFRCKTCVSYCKDGVPSTVKDKECGDQFDCTTGCPGPLPTCAAGVARLDCDTPCGPGKKCGQGGTCKTNYSCPITNSTCLITSSDAATACPYGFIPGTPKELSTSTTQVGQCGYTPATDIYARPGKHTQVWTALCNPPP